MNSHARPAELLLGCWVARDWRSRVVGSAVGQPALQDQAYARARFKGALLHACAFVALATSPAIAGASPYHGEATQQSATRESVQRSERGAGRSIEERSVISPIIRGNDLIVPQGTFDIAVEREAPV